jgi:lysophospholipase L1-like esterase
MRLVSLLLTVVALGACSTGRSAPPATSQTVFAPAGNAAANTSPRFADDIAAFEAADRRDPPAPGGILFVGSSTIRLWPSLANDFPGVAVVQRGFGGSEISDVVLYAPRIVLPYRPRLIVFYAGDNDLNAGESPESVLRDYQSFVELVWRSLPETRIAFVSIKPSGSRWAIVDKMRRANELIRAYSARDPRLSYVDVFTPMLGPDGKPREELFIADRLHLSEQGYELWRQVLLPVVGAR